MATPLGTEPTAPRPRVRQQARDVLVLMAFSAGSSLTLAAAFGLLGRIG